MCQDLAVCCISVSGSPRLVWNGAVSLLFIAAIWVKVRLNPLGEKSTHHRGQKKKWFTVFLFSSQHWRTTEHPETRHSRNTTRRLAEPDDFTKGTFHPCHPKPIPRCPVGEETGRQNKSKKSERHDSFLHFLNITQYIISIVLLD